MQHAKELIKKPVSYYYNKDNKTYDVTTALIDSVIHERNSGRMTIKLTQESIPALLFLGAGFTAYNKNIALSLPSVYAKRMYELCCRWEDKGFVRMSLDEFRHMFCVEDKFIKISELRVNVLDMSQKMLTDYADLAFRYELKKENGSRAFNWLMIWITGDNVDPKDKANQKAYEIIYNFMYELFRNSKALEITEIIAYNKELKRAAERITRLKGDIRSGRIKVHGREQYIRKVIQDEFKIPAEVMGERKAKKKKREQEKMAEAYIEQIAAKRDAAAAQKNAIQKPGIEDFKREMMGLFGEGKKLS